MCWLMVCDGGIGCIGVILCLMFIVCDVGIGWISVMMWCVLGRKQNITLWNI